MSDEKHRIKTGSIRILRFATALFFAAAGPLLPAQANNENPPDIIDVSECSLLMNGKLSEKLTEIQIKQTFHAIQKQKLDQGFAKGDRVLLRVASDVRDPMLRLLTDKGLEEFVRLAAEQPELKTLLDNLASYNLSDNEFNKLMSKSGEHPLLAMLAARSEENYAEMARIYDNLDVVEKNYEFVKLQAAFALNRLEKVKPGSRELGLKLVQSVIHDPTLRNTSVLSEAYGILARMYKDLFAETQDESHLSKAVFTYLSGFATDPTNYYPGKAALDMLYKVPGEAAASIVKRLTPSVKWALKKSLQKDPENYWTVATQFDMALQERDWGTITDSVPTLVRLSDLMSLNPKVKELEKLLEAWTTSGESTNNIWHLSKLVRLLENEADRKLNAIFIRNSLSPAQINQFPDTEGALLLRNLSWIDSIARSELFGEITDEVRQGIQQLSIHKFLQRYQRETNSDPGCILAATGDQIEAIEAISLRTGHSSWRKAFAEMGIEAKIENTAAFMDAFSKTGRPIILLIPPEFHSKFAGTATMDEYNYILKNYKTMKSPVEFVYGAYDLLGIEFYDGLSHGDGYTGAYKYEMIRALQRFLSPLGNKISW